MLKTMHFTIMGHVQGVFYRETTKKLATRLGVTGWVKNCQDGSVEVEASAEAEVLETFLQGLWQGPTDANVQDIVWQEIALAPFEQFNVVF
jgi:acylphosphatase